MTVDVVDTGNTSDYATSNWTFTVSPPETMAIYSQHSGYFYSGIPFPNTFGILAKVAGLPATSLTATLGGVEIGFTQRSGAGQWWDGTVDMNTVPVGAQVLRATATFEGNWTLNATYNVNVVETPDWLVSVIEFPQVTQTITPKGAGPYNESYSITEAFSWSLDQALGFNIKLPFVSGNVSLIPAIKVSLTATSSGNLTLSGSLSLTPPSINLGIAKIGISAAVSLKGTFTLGIVSGQITGIKWQSAVAAITVTGEVRCLGPDLRVRYPGNQGRVHPRCGGRPVRHAGGDARPYDPGFDEFIQGIQIKIQQFVGSFTLPLSVAVSFGIGIASIAIGGSISVALQFGTNTGLYISAGWINGTIFVQATALWWSDQWNLASGTIYNWTNPPPAVHAASEGPSGANLPVYDNGTNSTWVFHSRYYATSGYDRNVWGRANSTGAAISDIYPFTSVTAAPGPNGTYLFYTDDNVGLPVQEGLGFSGIGLTSSSNALASLPTPADPGFLVSSPKATALSDGSLYVLWDALPTAEETVSTPADLTVLELQGARYFPGNHTWGPIHTYTTSGLAQSYLADASSARAPVVAALVSPTFLLGTTSAERLLEFNLITGAQIANSSVTGLAEITGLRGSLGTAIVRGVDGNYSTVTLSTGAATEFSYSAPTGDDLVSAEFVQGSASTAILLDRGTNGSLLVLYDLATTHVTGTLALGQDVAEAEGIAGASSVYAFVRTTQGVEGWAESAGTFTPFTNLTETGWRTTLWSSTAAGSEWTL